MLDTDMRLCNKSAMRTDLIQARQKANLTQEQLAEAMGVTQPTISCYENGTLLLSPSRAKQMASLLDLEVLAILFPEDQKPTM